MKRRRAEKGPVQALVDAQCRAQPPRSGAKLFDGDPPAAPPVHDLQAMERLDGADEDGAARCAADDVEAMMQPVDAIDIGMADRPEHRRVACGPAGEAVRGRIGGVIGLGLHDRTADAVHQQGHAKQRAGDDIDLLPVKVGRQHHHTSVVRASRPSLPKTAR